MKQSHNVKHLSPPPGKNQSACWMMGSTTPTIWRDKVVIISVMFLGKKKKKKREKLPLRYNHDAITGISWEWHSEILTAQCASTAGWDRELWPCCRESSCLSLGTRRAWLRTWSDIWFGYRTQQYRYRIQQKQWAKHLYYIFKSHCLASIVTSTCIIPYQ